MNQLNPAIRCITFDCTGDPYELGLFWSELLERPLADGDKPRDLEAMLKDPDGGPALLFVRVPEGKTARTVSTSPCGSRGAPGRRRSSGPSRSGHG